MIETTKLNSFTNIVKKFFDNENIKIDFENKKVSLPVSINNGNIEYDNVSFDVKDNQIRFITDKPFSAIVGQEKFKIENLILENDNNTNYKIIQGDFLKGDIQNNKVGILHIKNDKVISPSSEKDNFSTKKLNNNLNSIYNKFVKQELSQDNTVSKGNKMILDHINNLMQKEKQIRVYGVTYDPNDLEIKIMPSKDGSMRGAYFEIDCKAKKVKDDTVAPKTIRLAFSDDYATDIIENSPNLNKLFSNAICTIAPDSKNMFGDEINNSLFVEQQIHNNINNHMRPISLTDPQFNFGNANIKGSNKTISFSKETFQKYYTDNDGMPTNSILLKVDRKNDSSLSTSKLTTMLNYLSPIKLNLNKPKHNYVWEEDNEQKDTEKAPSVQILDDKLIFHNVNLSTPEFSMFLFKIDSLNLDITNAEFDSNYQLVSINARNNKTKETINYNKDKDGKNMPKLVEYINDKTSTIFTIPIIKTKANYFDLKTLNEQEKQSREQEKNQKMQEYQKYKAEQKLKEEQKKRQNEELKKKKEAQKIEEKTTEKTVNIETNTVQQENLKGEEKKVNEIKEIKQENIKLETIQQKQENLQVNTTQINEDKKENKLEDQNKDQDNNINNTNKDKKKYKN